MTPEFGTDARIVVAFDGGCPRCQQLAELIAAESDGRVRSRDTRDAATREVLDEIVGPDHDRIPYLIRWRRGRACAYTGRRAVLELATVLGLRRGLRLYRHARALGLPILPPRVAPGRK